MTSMSRRRFMGSSVGVVGAAGVVSALPPTMQKALADVSDKPGSLSQIEHVIVFMQENRSFDTYFGTLRGVRGFNDPTAVTRPTGRPVWYQPDPKNPDGYELPFHLDTLNTSAAAVVDLSHAWTAQHAAWDHGTMDNWIPAHRAADGDANGPFTMGYYERADLPFHNAPAGSSPARSTTTPRRSGSWSGSSASRSPTSAPGAGKRAAT